MAGSRRDLPGGPPPLGSSKPLENMGFGFGPTHASLGGMATSTRTEWTSARQASDTELVATLVRGRKGKSDARRKASHLLGDVGGVPGLARLGDASSLMACLEPPEARRLAAAVELGLRCALPSSDPPVVVASSDDIVELLGPRLRHLLHEQVWLVALDARNVVTSRCRIAEGGQHGCALLTRDVLRAAVQLGAQAFVLAHNHPGGDPRPSSEDVHLTEQISAAATCIGIPLIDHIIVTRSGHTSLLNLGLIPSLAEDLATIPSAQSRLASSRNRSTI